MIRARRIAVLVMLFCPGCLFAWAYVDHANERTSCEAACDTIKGEHHSRTAWLQSTGVCGCQWDDGTFSSVPR